VSTFAPIERFPLATLAVARGTPFIDIRPVTYIIAFANLPRVAQADICAAWSRKPGQGSCILSVAFMAGSAGKRRKRVRLKDVTHPQM
jgi:hypothetical protein